MGLANFCVPDADLDKVVAHFTGEILANSWHAATARAKSSIADTEGMTLEAGSLAHEIHRSEGRGPEMTERLQRLRK